MATPVDTRLPELNRAALEQIKAIPDPYDRFHHLIGALVYSNPKVQERLDSTAGPEPGLTEGQTALATLVQFDNQILNGGLTQFFWNRPGWVEHVEPALLLVGMEDLAKVFCKALEELAGGVEDFAERRAKDTIEAYLEAAEDLDFDWFDDEYFGECDVSAPQQWPGLKDRLYENAVSYALANLDRFVQRPPKTGA